MLLKETISYTITIFKTQSDYVYLDNLFKFHNSWLIFMKVGIGGKEKQRKGKGQAHNQIIEQKQKKIR